MNSFKKGFMVTLGVYVGLVVVNIIDKTININRVTNNDKEETEEKTKAEAWAESVK